VKRTESLPMPATERGRETRQRLLDAAEAVFGRRGYHEAGVTDIVRAAGVSQGTFYIYFPSKKDIFVAVVENLATALRAEIRAATEGLPDRASVEREGFRAFFRFVARHPYSYRIVRQAEFVDKAVFENYYRSLAKGYRRGLEAAARAGEFPAADFELLSYALMGIADFVGMRYVLWSDPGYVPDPVLDDLMRFILAGLHGSGGDGNGDR
jgi:AcrR family transcriptional regulator